MLKTASLKIGLSSLFIVSFFDAKNTHYYFPNFGGINTFESSNFKIEDFVDTLESENIKIEL